MDFFWKRALEHTHFILCIDPGAKPPPPAPHASIAACARTKRTERVESSKMATLQSILGHCQALLASLTTHWVGEWEDRSRIAFALSEIPEDLGLNPDMFNSLAKAASEIHAETLELEAQAMAAHQLVTAQQASQVNFVRVMREYRSIVTLQRHAVTEQTRAISAGLDRLLQAGYTADDIAAEVEALEGQKKSHELQQQIHQANKVSGRYRRYSPTRE